MITIRKGSCAFLIALASRLVGTRNNPGIWVPDISQRFDDDHNANDHARVTVAVPQS